MTAWENWKPREKYVSEIKTSISERVINKEWAFASDGYLPLSPSLLKDMETDIKHIYHVTDIKGYQKLKTIQNRRIDIPCFTKGSWSVAQGTQTKGEVLVTLKGKASIFFEGDVNTYLDRNGLRWLSTKGHVSKPVNDIVYQFAMKILPKVIKKFDILTTQPSKITIDVGNFIYKKDGNIKRQFMKYYYDESKKLVNSALISKINKALGWRDDENLSHNEILVHNIKIIDTKLILSEESDVQEKMWENADAAGMTKFDVIDAADIADMR